MATNPVFQEQPQRHQSTAGYWFNEDDPIWELAKKKKLNVAAIRDLLDESIIPGFTSTLAFYARTMSASHTINIAQRVHIH
jgi:hypothetical protein